MVSHVLRKKIKQAGKEKLSERPFFHAIEIYGRLFDRENDGRLLNFAISKTAKVVIIDQSHCLHESIANR
jgi:hypothetical protein